ncbi:MAG TPA: hypothetical protein VKX28_00995 [Xanthobacteraceae bacterium]|nr:hypothetical protein [Xanthobacteraceae bacterium]
MTRFGAMLRALTIVALATGMSTAALAQQKTAKQCRDEWKANEADFKAKKIKEKDYVAQCQAGTATAPTAAPTATPAAATSGQKTAKQCRDEWKANEADFKAKKITQKAYVAECQAGTAPAPSAPTQTAAPATPPATPSAATSGQKTAKQCRDEWKANEADFKAKKIREKDYVTQCQAGTAPTPTQTAAPATPPATTTTTATPPTAPAPSTTKTMTPMTAPINAPKPAPSATAAPMGPNQFANEAQAKGHCPSDLVVWVNTKSNVYHFSGHNDYGKTKEGAYMCEKDALAAGDRAAKNEKHP